MPIVNKCKAFRCRGSRSARIRTNDYSRVEPSHSAAERTTSPKPLPSNPLRLRSASHTSRLTHAEVRHWLGRGGPEALALLKAAVGGSSPIEALLFALLLRFAWVMAELIHGAGHTLARALVDQTPGVLRLENVLEHRSPQQLARRLLPFGGWAAMEAPEAPIAWLAVGQLQPWKVRIKAAAPLLLHLILLAAACHGLNGLSDAGPAEFWRLNLLLAAAVSHLGLLFASRTDLLALLRGQAAHLYCGNFGVLADRQAANRDELLSEQAIRIFHQMGRDTELRGAQAGGGLVMALDREGDHGFVGHKMVNAKRGDLTPSLETAFCQQRRRARRSGWTPSPHRPDGLLALPLRHQRPTGGGGNPLAGMDTRPPLPPVAPRR